MEPFLRVEGLCKTQKIACNVHAQPSYFLIYKNCGPELLTDEIDLAYDSLFHPKASFGVAFIALQNFFSTTH